VLGPDPAAEHDPDLVLLDLHLPDTRPLDMARFRAVLDALLAGVPGRPDPPRHPTTAGRQTVTRTPAPAARARR
jgi:hypothetical protein